MNEIDEQILQEVLEQVKDVTPMLTCELIAKQLRRARDAAARIEKEGSVVRDVKGSVIPHPALSVEKEATKIIADLMAKYGAR